MFTKLKKKITVALLAVIAAVIAFAAAFMLTPKTEKAYAASGTGLLVRVSQNGYGAKDYESFSTAWEDALGRGTATVTLLGDVTVSTRLTVAEGKNITLALNGNKFTSTHSSNESGAIKIDGAFTLQDGKSSAENTITDAVSGTAVTVKGGVITGSPTGGIMVSPTGTFTMTGGNIAGNKANYYGAGVRSYGTFTMSGGMIGYNSVTSSSGGCGGVYVDEGTFTLSGGTICKNRGCGVYLWTANSVFNMTKGTVSDNTTNNGGGVYVKNGTFTMSGGTISGNTATEDGGGVYVSNGAFIMNGDGAKITGNAATGSGIQGTGGGVRVSGGTFEMSAGTIGGTTEADKNTANDGGGVYVNSGTFTMSGTAKVTANAAAGSGGGGVHVQTSGKFNVSGAPVISGNKSGSSANNVYARFTVAGQLTDGANICVNLTDNVATGYTQSDKPSKYFHSDKGYNCVYAKAGTVSISNQHTGGTATCSAKAVCSNCGEEYGSINPNNHTFENHVCTGCGKAAAAYVTTWEYGADMLPLSVDKDYLTFAEAWAAANTATTASATPATITMLADATSTDTFVVNAGQYITLEMKKHKLEFTGDSGSVIRVLGAFTVQQGRTDSVSAEHKITDPVTGKEITVYCSLITGGKGTVRGATTLGGGVFVYEGGEFTLGSDVAIAGNTAGYGGGVRVDEGAKFTMNDSEIIYNKATYDGGGVYVASGTFNMKNGTISSNTAENGGGVYVAVNGTFTMTGGTISGNKATSSGGGVLVSSGKFNVSGAPDVSENTVNEKANNCVNGGSGSVFITVTDTLTDGANICVGSNGGVANGYTQKESDGKFKPSKYFHHDGGANCIHVSNEQKGTVAIANHTGGTATCTEAAVCSHCGEIYGNALGHDIDSIVIAEYPTVYNNYTAGDTFDPTGMVIKPHCTRCQDTEAVTDYSIIYINADNKLHFGDNYVTVKYGDFTVNVTGLYVRAKQAEITWQYAEDISGDEGAIRWVDFASNKYTLVFNPQVEDLGNHFRAKFTGIDGNTVTLRATNDKISVEGDSQTLRNAGTYILRLDEADFTDYDFKNTNEVQVEITPAEIELNNTDNFYWTLNEYNSALRSGYIDETTFKYYSAAGAGRTRVVRSIVRNRNREVTIGLYGARSTESNASGGVYDIVYGDGCTATARGKYTATAKLTFTAAEKGNYKFKITDTIDPDRHMTATINADGTVDITKEWYVAVIDNGLLSQDKDGGTYGMEWGLAGWTFGNYQTQYAPRLEHGDPGEYNGVKMFTEDDNLVTFELYKVETTTPVTRVQIGETFNRAAFADYINGSVPAGNYVLKVTAGAYTTGEHEHWYTDDENIHGGGVTSGIYYDEFTREFNFTVAKADFSSTNAGTLNGKSYTHTYDGKLHLYKDFTLSADIYDTRDGEWAKAAYNGYYGGAQLYYKLNRWNGGDYVTESGLDGYQNQSQTPKNADTYTLLFTLRALNYNDLSGDNSFTVIINKAEVEVPADVSEILMVDYKYEVPQDALYTVSGNAIFTTAGEHTVTLALKDSGNYKWKDSENSTATVKVTLTMHDHVWETEFTVDRKPTVNEKGSKSKHCSICDAKSEITEIDKLRAEISASDENGSEGNEVIVSVSDGFEPEFSLTITEISKDNFGDYQSVAEEANGVVSFVYEVRLTKNGVSVLPDGTLTVKLKVPENLRGKNYKLLAVAGDTTTEMQYTVEGNYAVISADALEDFVFVGEKPAPAKNNTAWLVLIIILSLVIVGEVGYIVYRKIFLNKVREGK